MFARVAALTLVAAFLFAPLIAPAQNFQQAPSVSLSEAGATIESVTVETYGVVTRAQVWQYLSLRKGSVLEQYALDQDYANLVRLAGLRTRLVIVRGSSAHTVRLHWIVMAKWLAPTAHPFYGDQPLSAPIQGIGYVITGPPIDSRGSNFSTYSQFSRRANLERVLFTSPLQVDPTSGQESDFIFDTFGARGVFRASEPLAINIYSWTAGSEALWLQHETNGDQLEFGMRTQHSTTADSSGIVAPSLYPTNEAPAKNTLLEAGLSHGCTAPSTQWYPPYCDMQYRFEAFDAIGVLGATSEYQTYIADVARYLAVGKSTLAFHAFAARTGGVVPDSFLVCGTARAYPKAFCGTDAQTLTAEYRLDDERADVIKFSFFTETTASRVRGGTQPWALPTFQWHPDSGVGVTYRNMLRVDLAYGTEGGRLSVALQGQTF
jgi:hypothetical protein